MSKPKSSQKAATANVTKPSAKVTKPPAKTASPARRVALTAAKYKQLKRDVQQLASRADAMTRDNKVRTLWRFGRRIARERLENRSPYHNSLLRDLSRDTRISLRNLQYGVAFQRAFPSQPTHKLSWGHYRLLLDRPTDALRAHYLARTLAGALSVHALARLIADDQRAAAPDTPLLKRPVTRSYIYKAELLHVVDGDTLDLRVDQGFHSERRERFRLSDLDAPDLDTPEGRAARDFVYNQLLAAKTLVVHSIRTDLHGRYLAHVFHTADAVDIDTCFEQGHHLNEQLLHSHHATPIL